MVEFDEYNEKMTSTGFLNGILEEIIKDLHFIKIIQNYFIEIIDVVPNLLNIKENINKKIIYNVIELLLLISSIVIINQYAHNNMLNTSTIEGTIFNIITVLLLLNIIHTVYLYLFKKDTSGFMNILLFFIYKIPLYLIFFVFSLILYILLNIPNFIKLFFSGLNDVIIAAFKKLSEMLNNPEESKILYKYSSLYSIIFIIIIIMYYAAIDPTALSSNAFKYTIMIAVPIIFIISVVIPFSNNKGSSFKIFLMGIIATFFIASFYFLTKSNHTTFLIMEYITAIVGISAVLFGLSIFFYIMNNYFKSLSGWEGFITYFIFYIPCLLIDFVKYILGEFNATSSLIIVLLVIEIILLLLYFFLPSISEKIKWTKNNVLLPNTAFLDIKQNISSSELNKAPKVLENTDLQFETVYNQNYSFSIWVYLNPQSQNFAGYSKESDIFNYGEGKPKITYYNDMTNAGNNFGESSVDKFKIYFSNSTAPVAVYKFTLPSQKWNNIVVNFSSVKADLFVNGKIEKTYLFEGNQPMYNPVDFITIGDDTGVDGAICNVVYYPYPLTLMEITSYYNMLSLKNPPIY
jgi:hypothetical protein